MAYSAATPARSIVSCTSKRGRSGASPSSGKKTARSDPPEGAPVFSVNKFAENNRKPYRCKFPFLVKQVGGYHPERKPMLWNMEISGILCDVDMSYTLHIAIPKALVDDRILQLFTKGSYVSLVCTVFEPSNHAVTTADFQCVWDSACSVAPITQVDFNTALTVTTTPLSDIVLEPQHSTLSNNKLKHIIAIRVLSIEESGGSHFRSRVMDSSIANDPEVHPLMRVWGSTGLLETFQTHMDNGTVLVLNDIRAVNQWGVSMVVTETSWDLTPHCPLITTAEAHALAAVAPAPAHQHADYQGMRVARGGIRGSLAGRVSVLCPTCGKAPEAVSDAGDCAECQTACSLRGGVKAWLLLPDPNSADDYLPEIAADITMDALLQLLLLERSTAVRLLKAGNTSRFWKQLTENLQEFGGRVNLVTTASGTRITEVQVHTPAQVNAAFSAVWYGGTDNDISQALGDPQPLQQPLMHA